MILRRLAQSLKEQNWTAITIEFVLLVLGVFLGIQAANWNEARGDRSREAVYLASLMQDLRSDIDEIDEVKRVSTLRLSAMFRVRSRKSRLRRLGEPTSGRTTPCAPPGTTLALTALTPSVIRVTTELPPLTEVMRPISPSPVMTGSLAEMPSPEPASMPTVEYQTVGERLVTVAVTGS